MDDSLVVTFVIVVMVLSAFALIAWWYFEAAVLNVVARYTICRRSYQIQRRFVKKPYSWNCYRSAETAIDEINRRLSAQSSIKRSFIETLVEGKTIKVTPSENERYGLLVTGTTWSVTIVAYPTGENSCRLTFLVNNWREHATIRGVVYLSRVHATVAHVAGDDPKRLAQLPTEDTVANYVKTQLESSTDLFVC